ncbi:MAG: YegP family protein, partial [Gammaproteobacteria bacterium]|nr:YegP family protein [Gammaproteobacteria bacterium]
NPSQAEALGLTELNGGALFNTEFGIRHRGSTVPERSGVALSFRGRPANHQIIGSSQMYATAARDKGIESVKNNGTSETVKDLT